jgi:hypothetical protein
VLLSQVTAWDGGTHDYDSVAMADDAQIPLSEQLEEIGAQLDWVRGYL